MATRRKRSRDDEGEQPRFKTDADYDRHIASVGGAESRAGLVERALHERPSSRQAREAAEEASQHRKMYAQAEQRIARAHASSAPEHVKRDMIAEEHFHAAKHAARMGDATRAEHHMAQGDAHSTAPHLKSTRDQASHAIQQKRDSKGRFA